MSDQYPKYVTVAEFESLKSSMLTRADLDRATHIETGTIKWTWKSEFPEKPQLTPSAGRYARDIKFKKPFLSEPLVLLEFACLDANTEVAFFRINSKIEELSASGFRANIETWQDTKLFRFAVRWVAFTKNANCIDHGELKAEIQSTSGVEPD